MFVGIDVGGTYTDGVIIHKGQILATAKVPTYSRLSKSIDLALNQVLKDREPQGIKRIVLSTTIITNLIVQGKYDQVGIILLPGPGVNPASLRFAGPTKIIEGAVDYRGRVLADLNKEQLLAAAASFNEQGIGKMVVACKFSMRNKELEQVALRLLQKSYPTCEFLASSEISSMLNWVRRTNGAVYTLAIRKAYGEFVKEVQKTMEGLGLSCPIHILKADGGTMPVDMSLQFPLEALYSGPAASALGALATTTEDLTSVVLDIGGTTTDLALILKGIPLLAERGATITDKPVQVRALAVSSIPLGGDNSIEVVEDKVTLAPKKGVAMCLGGPSLTVTDLMVLAGYSDLPLTNTVHEAGQQLVHRLGQSITELTESILDQFIEALESKLSEMFLRWEEEPAYRIWQVLHKKTARPDSLICQGGPAIGLGKYWAQRKGWQVIIPPYAQVANAVGAALARNTLKLEYLADTEQQSYTTNIRGYQGKLPPTVKKLSDAKREAHDIFQQIAEAWGLELDSEPELLYEESFNMVRGWDTSGKILQVGWQTPPRLSGRIAKEVIYHE